MGEINTTLRKLKIGGREYLLRIPDIADLASIDEKAPLLDVHAAAMRKVATGGGALEEDKLRTYLTENPDAMIEFANRCKLMLIRCSVKPRIVAEYTEKEDEVWVLSIPEPDRLSAAILIMSKSDFTAEAAVELVPLSETESC